MSNRSDRRALPAAVYVPEETLKMIAKQIAMVPDEDRAKKEIILMKSGYYRATTDQVVLYQHQSRMPPPKADLMMIVNCLVKDITKRHKQTMGASLEEGKFLDFIRSYWDESFEMNSPSTLIVCVDLHGKLVDHYIEMHRFHGTLPPHGQE